MKEFKPWTVAAFGDLQSGKRATLTKISELYGKKYANLKPRSFNSKKKAKPIEIKKTGKATFIDTECFN